MNAFNFLSNPVADALGWTLLHAIWQGFALVLPVAVVLHVLRHKSGVLRYRISALTLLGQLFVSISTFFWYYQPMAQSLPATTSGYYATQINWQTVAQTLPWHQQAGQFLEAHLGQIVLVYLIGVALFGLRLAGGWLYLQRLSQTATQPVSAQWAQVTNRLQAALDIRAVVRVRESARIAVPMVVGVLKPILLLPIGLATQLSMREIEAVLAHELAHVKRHDYAVNLLQSVVEVLYFFHPALWWLSARVREEREHCCDDLAVQVCGGNGRILAQALARVEELRLLHQQQTPALAMAFASRRQHLLHRVQRVLGVPTRPFVSNGSLAGMTLATILLMSLSVYAVQQEPQQPKQPKPKSTQRFNGTTSGKRIGYELLDGRLTTIDVNGKRLPKTQVNQIQQQLDRVLTGQLNLDIVSQPNRDILLTIFEKSAGFEAGMAALSKGLDQIEYNNIVTDAMQEVKDMNYDSTVNIAMQEVKTNEFKKLVEYEFAPINDTSRISALQKQLQLLAEKMHTVMADRQPIVDSMTKKMAELSLKRVDFQKEIGQFAKQQSSLAKQQAELAKQQNELARKLNPLNQEISRLSQLKTSQSSQLLKQKELQIEILEKQMNRLGDKMGELGSQMGNIGQQMEPLHTKLEPYQTQLSILADSISKLYEPTYKLSEKIGELSEQITEEVERQSEAAMKQVEQAFQSIDADVPSSPARAPRPPKPARTPSPAVAPTPPVRINGQGVLTKPVVPVRPKAAPAPAVPSPPKP